MAKLKGQFIVEKRNDLNEMRAIGWTSLELRYLAFYLSKINARDTSTRNVRILLSEFAEIMGISRYDIRNIKMARDGLLKKIAVIPFGYGERAFQLFRKCDINKTDLGDWYIEFEAHDEALPLMFEFKEKYITYEVANVLNLQGTNHIRMYEVLKQYEHLGETVIILEELRKRLGINPREYTGPRGWVNFKLWVLDKCQKAISEKTDISFTYEPIRHGRKIGAVKFFIEKKEQSYQISLDEYEGEDSSNIFKMEDDKKVTEKDSKKIELEKAKENELWQYAYEIAKKAKKNNKSIKSTPERYAVGILKKWAKAGYSTVADLKNSGEISGSVKESSFDVDELERLLINK